MTSYACAKCGCTDYSRNEIRTEGGWLHHIGVNIAPARRPVDPLNRLLPALRGAGARIVWVNWGNRPDRLNLSPSVLHVYKPAGTGVGLGDPAPATGANVLEKDSWGAAIIDDLAPAPEDLRIDKFRMSGFWDGPLDSILRNLGVSTLLFSGVKMLFARHEEEPDLANNPVLRFLRRHIRVTEQLHEHHFFVRKPDASGKLVRFATPLFLALILIELADVVFAVDSVPAIFAITKDPFIVYTSNIFAILGLRALYFSLAAMIHRFVYLKYALALVLVFIGAKIFAHGFIGKVPAVLSLGVTFGLLAGGILLSLLKTRKAGEQELEIVSRETLHAGRGEDRGH